MLGLSLTLAGSTWQVYAGGLPLACLVAEQFPTLHEDCIVVDHAYCKPCNDCKDNLHWVTPQFNQFNTPSKPAKNTIKLRGVCPVGEQCVVPQGGRQAVFNTAETGGILYNLLCHLGYGDQLDKVPSLLNDITDKHKQCQLVFLQEDNVQGWKVDKEFIVIYNHKVQAVCRMLHEAQQVAKGLVEELVLQKQLREKGLKEKRKVVEVHRRRSDGVPYVVLTKKDGTKVEVLLDKDVYQDIHAQNGTLSLVQANRKVITVDGDQPVYLSQWLCPARQSEVVDHKSGNVYNHRMENLQVINYLQNQQNSGRWVAVPVEMDAT